MPEGREFELKFVVDARDTELLLRHPALVATAPRREASRLVSTYFDTPDAWLRRHRVSLRVRRSEAGLKQTIKRAGPSLIDRQEFEHEGGDEPDIDWLKTTPIWKVLEKGGVAAGKLEPHFSVDVRRTTLPVAYRGASIEAALDEGAIRAKGLSSPVSEFELELRDGTPADVFALGRRLARDLPLVPSLTTKSDHGHAVADLTWGQPDKGFSVDLAAIEAVAPAFMAITQACLRMLLKNAALIGGDGDAEAVHRARVAMRRLRAALTLFSPVLRRKRLGPLRQGLAWAAGKFGGARDSDVFATHLEDGAASRADLAAMMRRSRQHAHAGLRKALASARWRLLCLDLIDFSMTGVRRTRRDTRYRPFVQQRLARQRRRLARHAKGVRDKSAESLHALRKQAKILRYAIEMVADVRKLGTAKAVRRLRDDLETLQETLGILNDRHALGTYLRGLIEARPSVDATSESWARAAFQAGQLVAAPTNSAARLTMAGKAAARIRRSTAFA